MKPAQELQIRTSEQFSNKITGLNFLTSELPTGVCDVRILVGWTFCMKTHCLSLARRSNFKRKPFSNKYIKATYICPVVLIHEIIYV